MAKSSAKFNAKVQKMPKRLSLKQKLKKESKIVKVDNLKWKPVEVPDTLDDWEGFYGLEEIEGVDVVQKDGKVEFVVKDGTDEVLELEEADEDDDDDNDDVDEVDDDEVDNEGDDEFAGFEDPVSETQENIETEELVNGKVKAVEKSHNTKDLKETKENSEKPKQPVTKKEIKPSSSEELHANTFRLLENGETEEADLPEWKFEDVSLSSYTLNGLSALGFDKPTAIQKSSIPVAIEGKDVIGKASTGSGKTLAYGIPILEKYLQKLPQIQQNRKQGIINEPVGIIFAPTRELAKQVVDHLNKLASFSPLTANGIVSVTGGLSILKQERLLKNGPGIVVATPGRFLELIEKNEELLVRLASTDFVVLDEADRLLQDGHFEEFAKILEHFQKQRPKKTGMPWKWQTLVFSATFAKDLFVKLDRNNKKKTLEQTNKEAAKEAVIELLNKKLKLKDQKPAFIDTNPNDKVSKSIFEALVECGATERDLYLYYFLLLYPGTTLVFANSIDSVKRLVPMLNNLNIPTFSIHSSMIQKQRLRAIERFKESIGKNSTVVLIASDVAARGLDIPDIDHVAHYHLPRSADVYIHRSGRTARAGKEGVSVMFCSPQEASGPLKKLRNAVSAPDVKLLPIEMDLVEQVRPRVALAQKLADAEILNMSSKKEDSWVAQAAEELGLEGDIADFDDDILKRMRKRKEGKLLDKNEQKGMRAELRALLGQPLRKNARRSYITSGLQNLAHQMVKGNMHAEVLGHDKVNALLEIKGGNRVKKSTKKPKQDLKLKMVQNKKAKKQAKKQAKEARRN